MTNKRLSRTEHLQTCRVEPEQLREKPPVLQAMRYYEEAATSSAVVALLSNHGGVACKSDQRSPYE